MKSDIEIAQAATMQPIVEIAEKRLGIPSSALEPHGHYKAKLSLSYLKTLAGQSNGKVLRQQARAKQPQP
jgi:formate--tetrahydrofolate ligase